MSVHPGFARSERRFSRLALSWVGAIADVIATSPMRRVLGLSTRITLLLTGSAIIAASVAVTLWTQLGPGPLDVFIGAGCFTHKHKASFSISFGVNDCGSTAMKRTSGAVAYFAVNLFKSLG